MKFRKLGTSDLTVSEVSLGCWTLGGPNWSKGSPIGWRDVDITEAKAAVDAALDAGVNHFDNADIYGNGTAERRLSDVLGEKKKKVIIATKVGHMWGSAGHCYEPQHIRHQCEQSLINLRRDVIDLYYFHHGDFGENNQYLDDAIDMMRQLKQEGKIRHIGLSAYSTNHFLTLVPKIEPVCLQAHCNLLDQQYVHEQSPVAKMMRSHGLSLVCFGPLGQGLLLGKFDPKNPPSFEDGDNRKGKAAFTREELEKLVPKIEAVKQRFGSDIRDLARVAVQFLLSHDVVGCAIPGFRNPSQVGCNVSGADQPLSKDDVAFLKTLFPYGK